MTSGDSTGAALSLTPAPDPPTLRWLARDVETITADVARLQGSSGANPAPISAPRMVG